jgi:outer membrane protein OmpA-like peptidoglycan-associated protein
MKRTIGTSSLIILCSILAAATYGQDLVDNGSFEEFQGKGKLKKPGSIEMLNGWTSPTAAKADLFTTKVGEGPVSAKANPYGATDPKSGDHFAGIRVYSANDRLPRNYIQTALNQPMMAGKKYCVKYHVKLSGLSRFSTAELRAYLSTGAAEESEDAAILGFEAQVPVKEAPIVSDMTDWTGVCGIYEAKGGEQNLVIGNFMGTKETKVGKVKKPKGDPRPQAQHSYYFIDDVSVTPITVAAECKCAAEESARTGFIFGRSAIKDTSLSAAQKIDGQVFYFQRFQRDLHSSMKPFVTELAELLKSDPAIKVKLTGHLDELEKVRYETNEDQDMVGRERAEAVKNALIASGIEASRIEVAGRSDEELVDKSGSEVGMSKNRRVEVDVLE